MKTAYIPEIKICGITNLADARAAIDASADYLGFVLYPKSPRAIAPAEAQRIIAGLGGKIRTVGVFVNEKPRDILKIAEDCGLDIVQLCGEERPDTFRLFPLPVWRVIRIKNNIPAPDPSSWPARSGCRPTALPAVLRGGATGAAGGPAERYVLDAAQADLYGGTGTAVDWSMAAGIAKKNKIMLAGGLTPENVATAIRIVRPFGVDVSSGVELSRGLKDHEKMRFFIEVVRKACNDLGHEQATR